MTIQEAISRADDLNPGNTHSEEDKIRWLSNLDHRIFNDIIMTHQHPCGLEFKPYDAGTDADTELLVYAPFDDIYLYWLEAQMCYKDKELEGYNTARAMYNTELIGFGNHYNRTHKPLSAGRFRF